MVCRLSGLLRRIIVGRTHRGQYTLEDVNSLLCASSDLRDEQGSRRLEEAI